MKKTLMLMFIMILTCVGFAQVRKPIFNGTNNNTKNDTIIIKQDTSILKIDTLNIPTYIQYRRTHRPRTLRPPFNNNVKWKGRYKKKK